MRLSVTDKQCSVELNEYSLPLCRSEVRVVVIPLQKGLCSVSLLKQRYGVFLHYNYSFKVICMIHWLVAQRIATLEQFQGWKCSNPGIVGTHKGRQFDCLRDRQGDQTLK